MDIRIIAASQRRAVYEDEVEGSSIFKLCKSPLKHRKFTHIPTRIIK
jgi:hypothetical protein